MTNVEGFAYRSVGSVRGRKPHANARQIGEGIVALCRVGNFLDAIGAYYADDIVSIEAAPGHDFAVATRGIDAVRAKNLTWLERHHVHSVRAEGPFVNGERFSIVFDYEVEVKTGPGEGEKKQLREVAVYEARSGKVIREEFFE